MKIHMHFVLAFAALGVTANTTRAFERSITYCNKTSESLRVAIGYDRVGTSESTSEGWNTVAPCSCRVILKADLRATEIFTLTTRKNSTVGLLEGRGPLCVFPNKGFRLVAENANKAACQRAGGIWTNFAFHDTNTATSFTIDFRFKGTQSCNL